MLLRNRLRQASQAHMVSSSHQPARYQEPLPLVRQHRPSASAPSTSHPKQQDVDPDSPPPVAQSDQHPHYAPEQHRTADSHASEALHWYGHADQSQQTHIGGPSHPYPPQLHLPMQYRTGIDQVNINTAASSRYRQENVSQYAYAGGPSYTYPTQLYPSMPYGTGTYQANPNAQAPPWYEYVDEGQNARTVGGKYL